MRLLALDPGYERTAWVLYDCDASRLLRFGIEPNEELAVTILRERLGDPPAADALAVEMLACYGMPVGAEVLETAVWIGRFEAAWGAERRHRVYRRDVKLHLCGQARAKDSNVRQALLDRFGPGRAAAIGTKAAPGPLYGVSADVWAALGVAVTWADAHALEKTVS